MNLLNNLQQTIIANSQRNAFCINKKHYTYQELAQVISGIRRKIKSSVLAKVTNIGLITNDDIETYASILALWFEGKAYVPINPEFPLERNTAIIQQANIQFILDSSENTTFSECTSIQTKNASCSDINLPPIKVLKDDLAYILFTSGTTGIPKGVPINFKNISHFIESFKNLKYEITKEDRCLQMFELTFDMSVLSFIIPLIKGACIYTIPRDEIKYSYIYELMEEFRLTVAAMVPSILNYLRPYFDEINCPSMRLSLFAGEALPLDIVEEWSNCIPNALISNAYGPTECTIICIQYQYKKNEINKVCNGILSIGKEMTGINTIIIDEENQVVKSGKKGELCLSGIQLTEGYWQNEEKNRETFFWKKHQGLNKRFYRTGDLCTKDKDDDIMYLGRVDYQAKIQGYRVELSEIEYHSKKILDKLNVVALAITNNAGNTEIGLVLESSKLETQTLINDLKKHLPQYMIPTQIKFIEDFPLNSNGKTDRNKLKELFQ
ncbi:MAG: AMP-binding protein [Algibacter sp.]